MDTEKPKRGPGSVKGQRQGQAGRGRKPGAKNKISKATLAALIAGKNEQGKRRITPLEYMLAVLSNERNSHAKRAWAAEKAAPYVHRRMPLAIEGGDPRRPLQMVTAQQLRDLSPAELRQLQELNTKLIVEKVIEGERIEEDGS